MDKPFLEVFALIAGVVAFYNTLILRKDVKKIWEKLIDNETDKEEGR